jgi:rare lipoprotein A
MTSRIDMQSSWVEVAAAKPSCITKLAGLFLLCCVTCSAADKASWYGEDHRGLLMANGDPFNPDKFTAASWFYPLGTRVIVSHAGRSVMVEITDHGPAKRLVQEGRKIDLSHAAFARLANPGSGLIAVTIKDVHGKRRLRAKG